MGVISGWRTKFLQAMWQGQNKNNKLAVSCWVSASPLWEEEKGEKEEEEETHVSACRRLDSSCPRVSLSLSSRFPFLQKVPGRSRSDLLESPGDYHPTLGPFWHCSPAAFTCLCPSRDCEFPDHRARPVFPHIHPQWTANSRYSMNAH